jgi:hypothetical protein
MKIETEIQRHETAIKVLDAIGHFKKLKKVSIENFRITPNDFKYLRNHWRHEIEIYDMCIERMNKRYQKLMS